MCCVEHVQEACWTCVRAATPDATGTHSSITYWLRRVVAAICGRDFDGCCDARQTYAYLF